MLFPKPLEVKVELTEKCNYGCGFCFNRSSPQGRAQLSTKHLKQIIAKVSDEGIEKIRFTGGEPLLRKGLLPVLAFAKEQGLYVMLNTNGSLINEKNSQELSSLVDDFLVSIHAFDALGEKKLAGKDFFEKKLKAIKLLASNNAFLRAATILTRQNIQSLEKGHELVASLPFNQWVLLRPMPNADNKNPINSRDIGIAAENLLQINRDRKKGEKFLIENALPFCSYEPKKVQQVALGAINEDGNSCLVVDSRGMVKPSYFLEFELGNALQDSFLECWNTPFMQQLHSLHFLPGECRQCKYLMTCMGGSRFCALLVNKELHALDPLAMPLRYKSDLS